jgi:hypothetical protein
MYNYKKLVRSEIKKKCKELKRKNVLRAIKRNQAMFYKAPGKLIKKRRGMLEKTGRKKLVKVKDDKSTHTNKKDVIDSAFKYYSKTAKARPICNEVKYDFFGVCRGSIGEISEEI